MRSQTTRHVLRCLRGYQGLVPPPSLVPLRPVFRTYPVGCRVRVARTLQKRAFLGGVFTKAPRIPKELDTDPGYDTFLDFRANENDNIRPPPRAELVKAWRDFFAHKAKYNRVVNSTQALCAHRVLSYLSQSINKAMQLSLDDLRLARDCLYSVPAGNPKDHLILAKGIYTEIRRKLLNISPATPLEYTAREIRVPSCTDRSGVRDLYQLMAIMAYHGEARETRDMLMGYYNEWKSDSTKPLSTSKAWMPVIHGLAREGHEEDLLKLVSIARENGLEFGPALHGVMTAFYARRNNVQETKSWFSKEIRNNEPPARLTYHEILRFAIRNNEREWAEGVYRDLVDKLETSNWRQDKDCWDISYSWAVALLGKGVDHVEHMFRVGLEKTQDIPQCRPDIVSINTLLRVATHNNDPYLAERLRILAEKMGFKPNLNTHILQMEYRIKANDLDGAYTAYRHMPSDDLNTKLPVLNEFVRALCAVPQPNYDRILEVTSYLEDKRITLEPQTVVSICMAFLRNDEHMEVIDTLSLHTAHYSIAERQAVRRAFVDYCLDEANSTARIWDAYALLRQFFPELENAHREAIMDAFFDRKRADMACHVFAHMRGHASMVHRPTLATYARFFEGLGRSPDIESLRTVHNMLKMDAALPGGPDTKLLNGLMIGFASCGAADRALDFWRDITASAEGPSYQSLEIAFRACELTGGQGDAAAVDLWDKIVRMEIDVSVPVYSAYVAARAAHSHLEEAKRLLEEMEDVVGQRPNLHTLAYVYNALQSNDQKADFEAWAKEEYPPVWEKLSKRRKRRDADGLMIFKIARPWKA